MTDTVTILKAARDLIAKPENWTQGEFARNAEGRPVEEMDETAECFCLYGAVIRASGNKGFSEAISILSDQVFGSLVGFNDDHNHALVLGLFSKAIAALEESER